MDYALIVAGGKGMRMKNGIPKQFLPIGGKPILMRTLEAFRDYRRDMRLILVLPHDHREYWDGLCVKHRFFVPHEVVDGGETRFHSVRNALSLVEPPGLVGVHDGVRPFVSQEVIARCYEEAQLRKAVVPVVKPVDTMHRIMAGGGSITVGRDEYRIVQTPQVFDAALLKAAYESPYSASFTDDASVVEALGVPVHIVEGNRENIKITTPYDLQVAKSLVAPCST